MKSLLSLIALTIGFSTVTKAEMMTLDCKTEKGTSLVLVYDSGSNATNKPEMISLSVAGQDMTNRLEGGRFGTSGGRPTFGLTDFPQAGLTTRFNMYSTGTYTVYKSGSSSGEEHQILCEVKAPKKVKPDSGF